MSSFSNPDLTRELECASEAWKAPLLITGCARSGTTALARGLSTHPRICIFNEYSLYHPPVIELNVWRRISEMRDDNPPPLKISRDMKSLRSKLFAELPETASIESTRDWLFGNLKMPMATYGDKMPYVYIKAMDKIVKRYPRARFLLTLRDGRAVIASQLRQYRLAVESGAAPDNWMKPTVKEAEFLWLRFARRLISLRNDPPAPCLEVRYEQATTSPEELARKICDFVGMDYRRDEFQEFLDGYRPINTDTWREELPGLEAQLSGEFRAALAQLDYE